MSNRARGSVRRLPESTYDVFAEVALIGFSLAVIASFMRLFVDNSFFVPIFASTLSAHVLAAAVRWARGGLFISLLVSLSGMVVSAVLLFPPTTVVDPGGFLNREVIDGFGTDLQLAWDQFQSVLAPTTVTAPFLLLIAMVMWLVAFLSDWAAFRLRSSIEALVPGTAVFVFGALFAADQHRLITTILFLGAALLFVLTHRLGETVTSAAWLGSGAVQRGQAALLRGGVAIVAVTVFTGAVVAQALPGYGQEPVYDISELDQPQDPRVVLSPLVDIQSRLIDQPDVEVFSVISQQPDYWRITSLDVFDGRIWRSRGSFESAGGSLDTQLPNGTEFTGVTQQFEIGRMGGIWLPAAYEPAEVLAAPEGVSFEYETESGTLIVNRDLQDSDGLGYTLVSAVPVRDAAKIAGAGENVPSGIRDRYTELPADFSQRVTDLALEITAGSNTPYEKALALQNFFRDPTLFSYSLDVSNGHSSQRLEDFLFDIRVGYCEQFAGTYAAMARAIGLPARVAVGFTPGELDTQTGAYRVSGRHAHAWPEVWLDQVGWLRFEPTPGRGAPSDEVYTGQPFQQASNSPDNAPTTVPADGGPDLPPRELNPQDGEFPTTLPPADLPSSGIIGAGGLSSTAIVLWGTALLVVALIALTPLAFGVARAARSRRAVEHDPRRRIGLAWAESRSAVELLGVPVKGSDTPNELVDRVRTRKPGAATPLAELADEVTDATYSGTAVVEDRALRAEDLSTTLAAQARRETGRLGWWTHHADPRNVWGGTGSWGNLRPHHRRRGGRSGNGAHSGDTSEQPHGNGEQPNGNGEQPTE